MTCSISYTEKYRFIFFSSFFKCFLAPGKPVYWIICVLNQIRTGFIDKTICESWNIVIIRHVLPPVSMSNLCSFFDDRL